MDYTKKNLFPWQDNLNKEDGRPDGFYTEVYDESRHLLEGAKESGNYVEIYTAVSTEKDGEDNFGYFLSHKKTGKEAFISFDSMNDPFDSNEITITAFSMLKE